MSNICSGIVAQEVPKCLLKLKQQNLLVASFQDGFKKGQAVLCWESLMHGKYTCLYTPQMMDKKSQKCIHLCVLS